MPANSIELLRSEWERAKRGALDFIDSMPEDRRSFRPVPDVFDFAGQFRHIAEYNYVFGAAVFGVENPNTSAPGEAELRQSVASSYDFLIEGLAGVAPDALDEEIAFFKWNLTRRTALAKALEHHAHHRGQTAIYFRLQGLKPPSERLF